jgi:hypothetical protein
MWVSEMQTRHTTPGASPRLSGTGTSPASVPFLLMSLPTRPALACRGASKGMRYLVQRKPSNAIRADTAKQTNAGL